MHLKISPGERKFTFRALPAHRIEIVLVVKAQAHISFVKLIANVPHFLINLFKCRFEDLIFNYDLDEIVGKHHRIFCEPGYAESPEYAEFWQKLDRGEYHAAELKRIRKNGTEVWLQASYNPIFDMNGRPFKVVKFSSDITQEVEDRSLALLEMSTPVTKIWDGVLFAPIVGIVDSRRSNDIMNKALSSIVDHRARTLMLDIGGVAMVDTAVANHLIKIAKAAVLMGCKTIISGISPAIAQTITELGIDLGSIQTTSTIESALREAVTRADSSGRTTGP